MDTAIAAKAGTGSGTSSSARSTTGKELKGRQQMTMNTPAERTLADAVADVRYGIAYGNLNERFWQRTDTTLNLAQIMGGSLALSGAMAQAPLVAAVAGVLVAVVSGFQLALQPGRRSIDFRDARRKFHELNARAWQMTLQQLDAELEVLRMNAPQGLSAFNRPALLAVDAQHGHDVSDTRLTWRERLALAWA